MDKLGIIYRAINKLNGKCYVGQTYQKILGEEKKQ